jgi:acyl phosphate:glycerol-3-phosphate acyltransferase
VHLPVVLIVSYLLGSIPVGYLIVSAKTGSDVRQTGSGGTGATNVSRRAGKAAGVATLILDAIKGAGAVWFAKFMTVGMDHAAWYVGIAALTAILGHIFPVWLNFRGGKGVATGVGVFAVLAPFAVLSAAVIFVVIVLVTRYVSLGSMVAAISIPLFLWIETLIRPVRDAKALIATALVGAVLIVYAHRANIGRLVKRTENRF